MPDTVRTLAALQTLLADNVAGDIGAQDVRDLLVSVYPTVVVKSATETLTSSTVLQDDDELVIPVLASTSYAILAFLSVAGDTGGDIKVGWSVPAGATGMHALIGPGTAAVTFEDASWNDQATAGLSTGLSSGTLGVSNKTLIIATLGLVVAATAGDVTLQWAQRVSSATATSVFVGSFIIGLAANN